MEQTAPLVSVVMSAYNEATFISETIDSLLQQSYKNFELIIVDDASTDNTANIIRKYGDNRIILLRNNENKRLAFNLNLGIQKAHGKYIARMDADDICMPDRLVKQVNYLEQHPEIAIVGGAAQEFGDANALLEYPENHEEIKVMLLFENAMCHPAVMFRNDPTTFKYDIDCKASQDYELWSRLIWKVKFANLSDVVVKYRIHQNQTKHVLGKEQKAGAIKARKYLLSRLLDDPTPKETEIFYSACNYHAPKNENELIAIEELFERMLKRNREKGLFQEELLKSRIQEQFIRDCYASIRYGTGSFKILKKSKYYSAYKMKPVSFRLKMQTYRLFPKRG